MKYLNIALLFSNVRKYTQYLYGIMKPIFTEYILKLESIYGSEPSLLGCWVGVINPCLLSVYFEHP